MAWIESHQELGAHPKTRKLARLLSITVPAAIGHLHMLWWWALDYAQDGDIGRFEPDDIADACMWEGDAAVLLSALRAAGFLDDGSQLHDWNEYAGRLIQQRAANAERKRTARGRHADGVRTSAAVTALQNSTVPNPTVPDPTEPDPPAEDGRADAAPAPAPLQRPRARAITEADVAMLQAENPDVDVGAVARDYLNWSGSAKHADKLQGLRNQLRSPNVRQRFSAGRRNGHAPGFDPYSPDALRAGG